jgi:hypothetical protein
MEGCADLLSCGAVDNGVTTWRPGIKEGCANLLSCGARKRLEISDPPEQKMNFFDCSIVQAM